MLKGNIGPGCLSLPHAFTLAPFSVSVPGFALIAWLAATNSLKLSRLAKTGEGYEQCGGRILGRRGGRIGEERGLKLHRHCRIAALWGLRICNSSCLPASSARSSAYSNAPLVHTPTRPLVMLSISLQQLGVCTVYIAFVADNVSKLWGGGQTRLVMTAMLPLCLCYLRVRRLKDIEWLSMAATALLFGSIVCLLAVGVEANAEGGDDAKEERELISFKNTCLAMSTILYSFEVSLLFKPWSRGRGITRANISAPQQGACLVIPCKNAYVSSPSKGGIGPSRPSFDSVFLAAITVVCMVYLGFGVFCVATFGAVDDGSFSAFLVDREGGGGGFVTIVNVVVAGTVVGTYGLQLWPVLEIVRGEGGGVLREAETAGYEAVEEGDDEEALIRSSSSSAGSTSEGGTGGRRSGTSTLKAEVALVLGTYLVAMVVPNVSLMIR